MKAFREKYGKNNVQPEIDRDLDDMDTGYARTYLSSLANKMPPITKKGLDYEEFSPNVAASKTATDFNREYNVDDIQTLIDNAPGMNVTSLNDVPNNLYAEQLTFPQSSNWDNYNKIGYPYPMDPRPENWDPIPWEEMNIGTLAGAKGGYIRSKYSNGGRVGILAAF